MTNQPQRTPSARLGASENGRNAEPDATSLPNDWDRLWGCGTIGGLAAKQLSVMRTLAAELAAELPFVDRSVDFGELVGAHDLRSQPIHRWFSYKEAFSPSLPQLVLDVLDHGGDLVAADPFGGVATTALSLRDDPRVAEVRSLEYSPLAQSIGASKLEWPTLDPERLRAHTERLLTYRSAGRVPPPALAAFSDERIFDPSVVASLQAARSAIGRDPLLSPAERGFLSVGLAAIVEASSRAMKDGRALRILRGRNRRVTALTPADATPTRLRDPVKVLLRNQWLAMLEDLVEVGPRRSSAAATPAWHVRGDARRLRAARLPSSDEPAFPPAACDVAIFSPPYLNFIDYSEVYKLELWLMGHVRSQAQFRRLRQGTLRSHPSIRFGERPAPKPTDHAVVDLVHRLSGWLTEYGARQEVGPIVRQYFEDMYRHFRELVRTLKPGGVAVCVVANSTFSRREKHDGGANELWRVPVLTDVLLGHLGLHAGFERAQVWGARELRPRNVRSGAARESLVVFWKASSAA